MTADINILEQAPDSDACLRWSSIGGGIFETSSLVDAAPDGDALPTSSNDEYQDQDQTPMRAMGVSISDVDDSKREYDEEALTLPASTHSFLFTEPFHSIPFQFGLGIAAMSYACLILALINNVKNGSIPANVDLSVRIAQYLSILIALLMEEGEHTLWLCIPYVLCILH